MLYFLPGFYHDRCRNSYIQANGVIRALGYANAKNCDVRCINLWDTAESVTHRYKYKFSRNIPFNESLYTSILNLK